MLDGEMTHRPHARRRIVDLARASSGERDELPDALRRQAGVRAHAARAARDQRDRREIPDAVVRQLSAHLWRDRERPGITAEQGVAVGRRFRDGFGADHAARAAPVVDDDLLAVGGGQLLPRPSRVRVGRTAGRERNDDADRLDGVGLRACRHASEERAQRAEETGGVLHGMSPIVTAVLTRQRMVAQRCRGLNAVNSTLPASIPTADPDEE